MSSDGHVKNKEVLGQSHGPSSSNHKRQDDIGESKEAEAPQQSRMSESASDASPDISLSSQHTLRYSDVEPSLTEHNISHESSDSIEALEEPDGESVPADLTQSFLQHLTLNPGISGSSVESGDRISVKSEGGSGESHEVIMEPTNNPLRPESLSIERPSLGKKSAPVKADRDYSDHVTLATGGSDPASQPGESFMNLAMTNEAEMDTTEAVSQRLPQGTITRKGDLIQFVASDLQEKIKQSSPLSQPDAPSSSSRRSSIRSFASASSSTSFATSSGMSQSPGSSGFQQSPEDIPPIDAAAVVELENYASRVADSLDLMMGNIRNNLHKMSAITIGCQDAYKRSVDITCDSVDASIKTMYALMAKCEELNSSMGPVKQLASQIKEIKRILDLFEGQLTDK